MVNVKILSQWANSKEMFHYFKRMLKPGDRWNNLTFDYNKKADYYVMVNRPPDNAEYYDEKKTFVLCFEPHEDFERKFKQYATNCINNHYIKGIEWEVNRTYTQLLSEKINKTKVISTMTSSNYSMSGHKKRVNFLPYLDTIPGIDIYGFPKRSEAKYRNREKGKGYKILMKLKNYKGSIQPRRSKEPGLFPYKYTFSAENCSEKGYYTEKILDPIVSECLCFYWGCSDLDDYVDSPAYIYLDLDKPNESLEIVKNAIKNNEWEKRIEFIRKEKKRMINEAHLFPLIEKLIAEHEIK